MVAVTSEQARHEATRWTVVIDLDEDDGAVRAVARLHDGNPDRIAAEGVARLGPVERAAPVVGLEVAAARALRRLSERLAEAAKRDYDAATRPRTSSSV
jgi:hypothetical protein